VQCVSQLGAKAGFLLTLAAADTDLGWKNQPAFSIVPQVTALITSV
jgi:hypothetical protein